MVDFIETIFIHRVGGKKIKEEIRSEIGELQSGKHKFLIIITGRYICMYLTIIYLSTQ